MAKEKIKKNNNKFYTFTFILLFLIISVFDGVIYYLNIIPLKYYLVLIGISLVIILIFGSVLLKNKVKKKIKFFFSLLAIILIVLMAVVSNYVLNTKDIINKVTQKVNYKTENYSVIVLASNNYDDVKELKNEKVGYLDNGTKGTKKALAKLEEIVDTKDDDYNDVGKLADDLLNKKIEAILVEDSYKAILDEESSKFKTTTQVLYTFSVKIPEEKTSKKVDVTKQPYNIYISGIDTYGKITSVSRSDVNIIATINPKTSTILLTSIPRDYYVSLHGINGYKDKLTHAGIYGVEKSMNTIEDLLDIKINYYVKVNFTSVVKMVDTIGGISVHSDYNFTSEDGYKYYKGTNKMNGKQALSFARERHSFKDGDIQRGKDQMYVIEAVADKLMTFSSITKFNSLLDTLDETFETNISSEEISKLIKFQIDKNVNWNIETNYLTGTGSKRNTYTYKSVKSYVMEPDLTSVASAKTKISKVFNENS